jgi:hypothetical protein
MPSALPCRQPVHLALPCPQYFPASALLTSLPCYLACPQPYTAVPICAVSPALLCPKHCTVLALELP